jgi:hypothetical protein
MRLAYYFTLAAINSCNTNKQLESADNLLNYYIALNSWDTVTITRLQNAMQLKRIHINHINTYSMFEKYGIN